MAKSMRRNHDGAFKTRLALEAVKREKTMAQFQANIILPKNWTEQ